MEGAEQSEKHLRDASFECKCEDQPSDTVMEEENDHNLLLLLLSPPPHPLTLHFFHQREISNFCSPSFSFLSFISQHSPITLIQLFSFCLFLVVHQSACIFFLTFLHVYLSSTFISFLPTLILFFTFSLFSGLMRTFIHLETVNIHGNIPTSTFKYTTPHSLITTL